MSRFTFAVAVSAVVLLTGGQALVGGVYLPPVGGWTYEYTGDAAAAGSGGFTALDGTWSHDNGSDEWDGTAIGTGRPGGVWASGGFARIQDTGDPRDYGMNDPGSNRKLYFAHSITNDVGAAGDTILDGVTLSFRARVATGAPLDDLHPDGGGGTAPWPAGGDGYIIHNDGKGAFGVHQEGGGDKIISFALALASDHGSLNQGGLIMNNLNGTTPTGTVDTGEAGTQNLLPLDPTQWHEFWVTIQQGGTGTHVVDVYMDGSLTPTSFDVTAGNADEGGGDGSNYAYLAMGHGATDQSGAMDVDFFAYHVGVQEPETGDEVPEPATMALVVLGCFGALAAARRRRGA